MRSVLLVGATPLVVALGVRLARVNWPIAGVWDQEHSRALTATLRVGCSAFPEPREPLSQCGFVLLGEARPAWLAAPPPELVLVGTWEGHGEQAWMLPERPFSTAELEQASGPFEVGGACRELAEAMGLICSTNQV